MSGSSFVGLMGGAYDNGVVIFNYEWTAAFVLIIFAIFVLPSYLKAKVSTVPEFLERRYDVRSRRAFSAFTILAIMFIDTAGALYAGGLVISNVTEYLNLWTAVAVLALVAGIYTILGGLSAVVVTDTVQAILLIVGAAALFWIGLDKVRRLAGAVHRSRRQQEASDPACGQRFPAMDRAVGRRPAGLLLLDDQPVRRAADARGEVAQRGADWRDLRRVPEDPQPVPDDPARPDRAEALPGSLDARPCLSRRSHSN